MICPLCNNKFEAFHGMGAQSIHVCPAINKIQAANEPTIDGAEIQPPKFKKMGFEVKK